MKTAICRACDKELIGKPYENGNVNAYHPITGDECKISFWGGFVCDDICDKKVDNEMKASIDDIQKHNIFY